MFKYPAFVKYYTAEGIDCSRTYREPEISLLVTSDPGIFSA